MSSMLPKTRLPILVFALALLGCSGGTHKAIPDTGVVDAANPLTAETSNPPAPDTANPATPDTAMPDTPAPGADASMPDSQASDTPLTVDTAPGNDSGFDQEPPDGRPADAGCSSLDDLPAHLPSIDFSAYHTLDQMLSYLRAVAAAAPNLAQYKVLGVSKQGRDLGTLVINATCLPSAPTVFFNGAHHGDEAVSAEAVLALPDYLLRRSASDATVRALVQTYSFALLPVVNPDGFVANSRLNADGEDINRDYPYPGRGEADSFKTREALLIKSLQESLGFAGAIAFHSGAEEVLWPWCYTGTGTADEAFFLAAGKKTAVAMGLPVYQQSYDDYPTQGEYIDYAYAKSRTLAATIEVSTVRAPSPPLLGGVVERACKGAAAWTQALSDRVLGRLHGLPAGPRPKFPFTAPFDGRDRLE